GFAVLAGFAALVFFCALKAGSAAMENRVGFAAALMVRVHESPGLPAAARPTALTPRVSGLSKIKMQARFDSFTNWTLPLKVDGCFSDWKPALFRVMVKTDLLMSVLLIWTWFRT